MAGMSTAAIESGAASDMAALGPVHAGAVVQTCPKVVLEIGVFLGFKEVSAHQSLVKV